MEALFNHLVHLLLAVGPWIVLATTFLETACFIGLVVPAEPVVLLAGALAATGRFHYGTVVLATLFGALLGDQTGYVLGRYGGNRVVARGGFIARVWARYEPAAAKLFRRHAAISVSLARFISFVRTLMPWFAGMSNMSYRRFLAYDLLGVVPWAFTSVGVGFAAGESWRVVARFIGNATSWVFGVIAFFILIGWVRNRMEKTATAKQPMLRVALTGNIASGKSAVVKIWRSLGASVVDADILSRQAIAPGTPGFQQVLKVFGTADRDKLRDIVFHDALKRKQLEKIVHPEVARLRRMEEERMLDEGARVIVHDIPLLFEAGLVDDFDLVVLIDAPENVRLERIVSNRALTRDEAKRMIDAQMNSSEKRLAATYVIDNDGTLDELQKKATEVWNQIQERLG